MSDFYSILEEKIRAVRADPDQSRQVVYDLARYALRNKIYGRSPLLTAAQVNQQMIGLEAAIAMIEAKLAGSEGIGKDVARPNKDAVPPNKDVIPPSRYFTPPLNHTPAIKQEVASAESAPEEVADLHVRPRPRQDAHRDLVVLPPRNVRHDRFAHADYDDFEPARSGRELRITPEAVAVIQMLVNERNSRSRRVLSWLDGAFRVGVVAAIAFAGYLIWSGRLGEPAPPAPAPAPVQTEIAKEAPSPVAPAEPAMLQPSVPLPTAYGVYAIHEDRLFALTRLTATPVDARAKHLLQTTEPSRSVFADGRLSFAIYRRDLANAAPVSVPVRIAARISSMLRTGPGGTLVTVRPEVDTWLIYSAGYMFRTQPVAAHPEMILVRPDNPDLVLPPGRYVLLMNDEPFEFSVAGEIADPRSCVEGFPTPHGPVFHVCKGATKTNG
jgi:hypothetical protein